jgi:O-antigen ligase
MPDITDSQQSFINTQFFNLTVFALIFGVIFYDSINAMGFSYVDEICALLLFFLFLYRVFCTKTWAFDRAFFIVICIFIFYLIYSFIIQSNTKEAILMDFVIQFKPYLSFFCVYALRPVFSSNQKTIIRQLAVLCSIYVLIVGVTTFVYYEIIEYTFVHVSRIATASTVLAMIYLYCSDYSKKDKLVFVLILAIGLLSTRSKHFGFSVLSGLLVFYISQSFKLKLNLKNIFFAAAALALVILVSWKKIYFYFFTGGFGSGRALYNYFARVALYIFSLQILIDYFPFGSGFASYATYTSGVSYSSIYTKYGMNNMHGLTKANPDFIADTYYPALAQFGVVGVILFFYFWAYLMKRAFQIFKKGFLKESVIAILIIMFFLIECTSDSTITHNRGMFMMMILGLVFADAKR